VGGGPGCDALHRGHAVATSVTAVRRAAAGAVAGALCGALPDGTLVERYTLGNGAGMRAVIMSYGARLTELTVPDRHGRYDDVLVGQADLAGYVACQAYAGAVIGRCANRLAGACFELDGVSHEVSRNDGRHSLHGGGRGFDRAVWSVTQFGTTHDGAFVALRHVSRAGAEGYPGTVTATATYTLSGAGTLWLDLSAVTDRATLVNLTHHPYFNLSGDADVLGHVVRIAADHYLPVDAARIPTGDVASVAGTPFDFREPAELGPRLRAQHAELELARGYDHHYVARRPPASVLASVEDPGSGRRLEILSDAPGAQFYTGNWLDRATSPAGCRQHPRHAGLCIEPQGYPDAPHHPHFPSAVLRPGETYRNRIGYRFSIA